MSAVGPLFKQAVSHHGWTTVPAVTSKDHVGQSRRVRFDQTRSGELPVQIAAARSVQAVSADPGSRVYDAVDAHQDRARVALRHVDQALRAARIQSVHTTHNGNSVRLLMRTTPTGGLNVALPFEVPERLDQIGAFELWGIPASGRKHGLMLRQQTDIDHQRIAQVVEAVHTNPVGRQLLALLADQLNGRNRKLFILRAEPSSPNLWMKVRGYFADSQQGDVLVVLNTEFEDLMTEASGRWGEYRSNDAAPGEVLVHELAHAYEFLLGMHHKKYRVTRHVGTYADIALDIQNAYRMAWGHPSIKRSGFVAVNYRENSVPMRASPFNYQPYRWHQFGWRIHDAMMRWELESKYQISKKPVQQYVVNAWHDPLQTKPGIQSIRILDAIERSGDIRKHPIPAIDGSGFIVKRLDLGIENQPSADTRVSGRR